MPLRKRVEDVMLPLAEYAVVPNTATLEEALQALAASQTKLPAEKHPHRAVLVKDETGRVVGKMGHQAFLSALLPERKHWPEDDVLARAGVSDDVRLAMAENLRFLGNEVIDIFARARHVRVIDVCVPQTASLDQEASLLDAVRAFLRQQTLSLLVCRHGKPEETIGILRLADLFDELSAEIMKHGEDE